MDDVQGSAALVELVHHRWAVPVLAWLYRWKGSRFVHLCRGLGASAGGVREALDLLIAHGLTTRAADYGHPLRPEYALTPSGLECGAAAAGLEDIIAALPEAAAFRGKWALPVLLALRDGPARFGEIRRATPGITDRALSLTLRALEESQMILRRVEGAYPPRSLYELPPEADAVVVAAAALQRSLAPHRQQP